MPEPALRKHIVEPPANNQLHGIEHQLTRIADTMSGQSMQIDRDDALKAWPLRVYQDEYLRALQDLGIELL
ncbi:hypothetical protein [Bifidobacterium xylocopae]|uniref:Uncharacterized protein n=1 Tax=Bifidobacterium xylocopae TaxID=2493119 RepID=A0A366KF91_9BIFI|nr:hypothetical protein [Bifidobacterium xylocopae]RBQ00058.1 hypothetical protein CRD59_00930 [Bifidobacterium xylocopae]